MSKEKVNPELEEVNIPIDISDILFICKEYSLLGPEIQKQIQLVMENGVQESIKDGSVKKQHIIYLRDFLNKITKNPYFGDAVFQAKECIFELGEIEEVKQKSNLN